MDRFPQVRKVTHCNDINNFLTLNWNLCCYQRGSNGKSVCVDESTNIIEKIKHSGKGRASKCVILSAVQIPKTFVRYNLDRKRFPRNLGEIHYSPPFDADGCK
jgi:hypothetical protein